MVLLGDLLVFLLACILLFACENSECSKNRVPRHPGKSHAVASLVFCDNPCGQSEWKWSGRHLGTPFSWPFNVLVLMSWLLGHQLFIIKSHAGIYIYISLKVHSPQFTGVSRSGQQCFQF